MATSSSTSASSSASVGIIGTAGRGVTKNKLTKEIFDKAIDKSKEIIKEHFKLQLNHIHLVSGGAAWADHIAVALFLLGEVCSLTLHFPAKFLIDADKPQFFDSGIKDYKKNPGRTANIYHNQFSEKIKDNSLKQIQSAIHTGAKYNVHGGYHDRNTHVAKDSHYLIAFTWNDADMPLKGTGTFDTWKKCKSDKKIHIPLSTLVTDIKEKEEKNDKKVQSTSDLVSSSSERKEARNFQTKLAVRTCKRKLEEKETAELITSTKKHKATDKVDL